MIVVKVGGSLFTHPQLGPGLCRYLTSFTESVLIVPGGGLVVDAIRTLDDNHHLGEEASHWLALRALDATADFLRHVLSCVKTCDVLNCYQFVREDEQRLSALPHSWEVTSDSLAARVAIVRGASRLILLKSRDIPAEVSWSEAAAKGWVDSYFPRVIANSNLPIGVINFCQHLECLSHPA